MCVADPVGPRTVTEHVEQPAVRLVPVPLAGHVTHVLQPADLLLDEHAVPGRFRCRSAQRSRVRPVLRRLLAGPTAPVAPLQQPQRRQSGGWLAPDQHVVVVRVSQVAAKVVQRAAPGVRPESTQLERGNALSDATVMVLDDGRTSGKLPWSRCGHDGIPHVFYFDSGATRRGRHEKRTLYIISLSVCTASQAALGKHTGGGGRGCRNLPKLPLKATNC